MSNAKSRDPDEALVELVVLSETDSADQLAAAVGLPPDEAWNRGDPKKTPPLRHKFSGIVYRSRRPDTARLVEHLDDLLARLAPAKSRIAALSARLAEAFGRTDLIRVSMLDMTSNRLPGYDFSPRQLLFVGEIGAHLGLTVDVTVDCEERCAPGQVDAPGGEAR